MKTPNRREFLASAAGIVAAGVLAGPAAALSAGGAPHQERRLSSNVYPWMTFFRRQGRDWAADLDASLAEFARSGIAGFEPSVGAAGEIGVLAPLLEKHGLRMESVYVNSTLHEEAEAEASIGRVLAIAGAARRAGARIVVTNPSPLGGGNDKSDAQLRVQAASLDRLGAELRGRGLTLAYHNHDPEMRRSAREYHHMMLATDPRNVGLCLEPHWIYRGAGDSQVALFDIVKLHGSRTVEVHLRQSSRGVWTETLGPGDIDYPRLAGELDRLGVRPHLVLEQAVEQGTPATLGPVEAHRRSREYATRVFGVA